LHRYCTASTREADIGVGADAISVLFQ
jgi:hypothetical protein